MNAMAVDIAMGGSTNTVLHLLAIANEAGVDFNMADIDELSRRVPVLCKVAPSSSYHMEDVHRAGGIMSIMGALASHGMIDTKVNRVCESLSDAIEMMTADPSLNKLFLAAPGGKRSFDLGSQEKLYDVMDTDRETGCIRDVAHAYSSDGGLAILRGNIASHGCIVKTAGVDLEMWQFKGPAVVFHSQEKAVEAILDNQIKPGQVIVIIYEGPKGGPGMQEMLYPTSYLVSKGLDKKVALITDGRFSGGTSGLSIGHISPEAASEGTIGLIRNGDIIIIDIAKRSINVDLSAAELASRLADERTKGKDAFQPDRNRKVSTALQMYGMLSGSADTGAVRQLP